MNTQSKTLITPIDLEQSLLDLLKFLLSYYFENDYALSNQQNGRVCITQLKSSQDQTKLNYYQEQKPNNFFIVLSKKPLKGNNLYVIDFPFSPRKIVDTLHEILKNKTLKLTIKKEAPIIKKVPLKKEAPVIKEPTPRKTPLKPITPKINEAFPCEKKKKIKIKPLVLECLPVSKPQKESLPKKKQQATIEKTNEILSSLKTQSLNIPKKKTTGLINTQQNYKKKQVRIKQDPLRFLASRLDIDLSNPKMVARLIYSEAIYLQGKLNQLYQACSQQHRIRTLDTCYGLIYYDPKKHRSCIETSNTTLQNISSIANIKMNIITPSTVIGNNLQWEDADALLWKTSIWASRGRLPSEFSDIDRPFKLKHWPNLTRFMITPSAMEITTLWVNQVITLRETVSRLVIPQRHIFSFYSAAIALDLVVFYKTKPVMGVIKTTKPKKRKGFIDRLLSSFKHNNIEDI